MSINLQRGEIRLWLYLSEPLCQRIAADLGKGANAAAAFAHIKHMVHRLVESLKATGVHHRLSRRIHIIEDNPRLSETAPHWLRHVGHHLAAKITEWTQVQLAQCFRNSAEEFKRACASHHDGVTLRITMTRVPGMDLLRSASQGKTANGLLHAWPKGSPAFQVTQHPGHKIHKLRN